MVCGFGRIDAADLEKSATDDWPPTIGVVVMPCVCAYCPGEKLARDGEHSGVVMKAFRKAAPSCRPINVRHDCMDVGDAQFSQHKSSMK
jgi:hypothetical protein